MSSDTSIEGRSEPGTEGVVIRENGQEHRNRKYTVLQRELTLRLNHLRAEAREATESYMANIESDVSTLVEFLDGSSEVRKPRDVKAKTLAGWMKTLDSMTIKPHKGRTKDLRRIERAIGSLMENAFE